MISDLPKGQLAVVAALIGIGVLLFTRAGAGNAPAPVAPPITVGAAEEDRGGVGRAVVHVAGAVRRPGVYRMTAGARVGEAVERAGGATRRADLASLNLAARVQDGQQILVTKVAAAPGAGGGPRAAAGPAAAGPAAAGPAGAGPGGAGPAGAPAVIDLNTATLEQLDTLEGIGPATAQKILEWRTEHGRFDSVEELAAIPGIGEKRMATLRLRVRV